MLRCSSTSAVDRPEAVATTRWKLQQARQQQQQQLLAQARGSSTHCSNTDTAAAAATTTTTMPSNKKPGGKTGGKARSNKDTTYQVRDIRGYRIENKVVCLHSSSSSSSNNNNSSRSSIGSSSSRCTWFVSSCVFRRSFLSCGWTMLTTKARGSPG